MLTLSTSVRYLNIRIYRATWLRPRMLLLLAGFLGIVWLMSWHDTVQSPDVALLRQERYLKYQATEEGRSGPGEHGKAVKLTEEEAIKYKDINDKEGFNFAVSEKVALDRSLPDHRSTACKARVYPKDLPRASVILVYHNEAFSVIMRTVHSVVNRSPPQYIEEVILLDDSSTRPELLEPLHQYVRDTWPDGVVRVIRTPDRYGLIKAKLYGAEEATGEVLIFLDAHCEAAKGWLEPMLADIKEDPSRIICPIIGNIGAKTLRFDISGGGARGGFSWFMLFYWESLPARDRAKQKSPAHAFRSPTMAGGLFAANKEFFFRIGAYDPKMEIWGGENLDLSFRTWMCHGSLLFHPCSHVGHIFRATHPYGFPDKKRDYHGLNSKRVAEVWMDEFKKYYYLFRPDLLKVDVGDLSDRRAIREREKCHSFEWYLDNVYPEKFKLDVGVIAFGSVRNPSTDFCFDVLNKDETSTYALGVYACHPPMSAINQIFSLTPIGEIRREGTCLRYEFTEPDKNPTMHTSCDPNNQQLIWTYDKDSGEIKHKMSGFCLDVAGLKPEDIIVLKPCDGLDTQKWEWTNYYGAT